jgi:PKHD-type hydroxylase
MAWMFEQDFVDNFAYAKQIFTKDECEKIIQFGKSKKNEIAKVDKFENKLIDVNYRKANISWIESKDNEMQDIFLKLSAISLYLNEKYFNFDLNGFVEDLQFTEYLEKGDKYSWHIDKCHGQIIRKLSVVVQLTPPETYKGGQLQLKINENSIDMTSNQGDVIVFPSYVLHQVTPIEKGIRHSLVGWVSGKAFK